MEQAHIILAPVQSEKAFAGLDSNRYTFKVHPDADKVQIRKAVEQAFKVTVVGVATAKVPAKPKRRGMHKGTKPGYKKATVQLKQGDSIQIFEGVH